MTVSADSYRQCRNNTSEVGGKRENIQWICQLAFPSEKVIHLTAPKTSSEYKRIWETRGSGAWLASYISRSFFLCLLVTSWTFFWYHPNELVVQLHKIFDLLLLESHFYNGSPEASDSRGLFGIINVNLRYRLLLPIIPCGAEGALMLRDKWIGGK